MSVFLPVQNHARYHRLGHWLGTYDMKIKCQTLLKVTCKMYMWFKVAIEGNTEYITKHENN